jgi:hypothetical protein
MRCAKYIYRENVPFLPLRDIFPPQAVGTVTPCPPWGMALTAGERKGGFHINPNDYLSSVPKNGGWPVCHSILTLSTDCAFVDRLSLGGKKLRK